MAQQTIKNRILLSDVILHEYDSSTGYTRDKANVTPDGVMKCGLLVARDKGLDLGATWTKATAGDLVDTKELAVFLGDAFQYETEVELLAVKEGEPNAVVLARGNAILASWVLEVVNKEAGLTDEDLKKAYALLAQKGILVEKTYGKRPTV